MTLCREIEANEINYWAIFFHCFHYDISVIKQLVFSTKFDEFGYNYPLDMIGYYCPLNISNICLLQVRTHAIQYSIMYVSFQGPL